MGASPCDEATLFLEFPVFILSLGVSTFLLAIPSLVSPPSLLISFNAFLGVGLLVNYIICTSDSVGTLIMEAGTLSTVSKYANTG
jgi:hypothetical protein